MTSSTGPKDSVDRLLASWAEVEPGADRSAVAVIARLARVRRIIDNELEATFAEFGLNGSDFAALVTLRRLDGADGVSQRRLMRELGLTSGTVSVRVDRLTELGLATRTADVGDRRNTLVRLTDAGRDVYERVAPAHLATEDRLLAALDGEQRATLTGLLRQLLVSFEGSVCEDELPRLGLMLAPAHVTVAMRRAVGLPEVVGLLVRSVTRDGPAASAGMAVGDVLVRANGRELRSITSLHAALREVQGAGKVSLSGVRGTAAQRFTIQLPRGADLGQGVAGEVPPPEEALHEV